MKFKRRPTFNIANSKIMNANIKLESLDYKKWIDFVESHNDYFIWNENTTEGKQLLQNVNEFNERIRFKILSTLNKKVCFSGFSKHTNLYDVNVTFYDNLNWITIQFSRTPKSEDLKILLEMANYLDALLLKDGTEIIDEKVIEELEKRK
jgi:hypothetical protein